jgi:hypothetical protein
MDAPTEWTYGGKLDWSSADKLRLAPFGMVMRTINAALYERRLGFAATLIKPLAHSYLYYNNIQLHCRAQEILSSFINHTKIITDESSRPVWTEDNMAEALGEELIEITPLMPYKAEWAYQQYRMINLLKWKTYYTENVLSAYHGYVVGNSGDTVYEVYNDAVNKFYTQTAWGPNLGRPGLEAETVCNEGYVAIYKSPAALNTGLPAWPYNNVKFRVYAALDESLTAQALSYFYLTKCGNWDVPYAEFWDGGRGYQEGKFNLLQDLGEIEILETQDYTVYYDDWGLPPLPSFIPGLGEFATNGFNSGRGIDSGSTRRSPFSVLKFDGENGFKFRDW